MAWTGEVPLIYADGSRVFIDIGHGVFEASVLAQTQIERTAHSDFIYSMDGSQRPTISLRGRITLEFMNFALHSDKQLSDIPKELAGTLSVIELFGVIDKKLTERENES